MMVDQDLFAQLAEFSINVFSGKSTQSSPNSWVFLSLVSSLICLVVIVNMVTAEDGDIKGPREPPPVSARFPYFSHLWGLSTKRLSYIQSLRDNDASAGICVLALPCMPHLYVATGARQVREILKCRKTISFAAAASQGCCKLGGLSAECRKKVLSNASNCESTQPSLFTECKEAIHACVMPGPAYDSLINTLEQGMKDLLDSSLQLSGHRIPLHSWVQTQLTLSITNAIYGTQNPIRDPDIAQALWAFNSQAIPLMGVPDILLPYLLRSSYKGREKVVQAFADYLRNGDQSGAAELVIRRQNLLEKHQIDYEDRARIEVMNCIVALVNTGTAAFWTIFNTYQRPDVLAQARSAAERYTASIPKPDALPINLHQIRHDPLLASILNETLRLTSNSQEARQVHAEGAILPCGYRLRGNSLILMPARSSHMDPALFAHPPPAEFDHTRFLQRARKGGGDGVKYHNPPGYRAFGAGDSLCPGRYIATTEILGLLALFVTHFDLDEMYGGEKQPVPAMTFAQAALGLPRPEREVWVTLTLRKKAT